jgi:hypothetical protein
MRSPVPRLDPTRPSPTARRSQARSNVRARSARKGAGVDNPAYTAIAWRVGLSLERLDIAGAEGFHSLEGNMCGTVMRGAVALPGNATSRAKGSYRNLEVSCLAAAVS